MDSRVPEIKKYKGDIAYADKRFKKLSLCGHTAIVHACVYEIPHSSFELKGLIPV